MRHQRCQYRANKMVPAQMEALTVLGFKWRLQHHAKPRNRVDTSLNDEHFFKMVDRFVLYTEETGNRWIPTKYEDKLLVHWGVNMRRDKRTGKLREDRIKVLDKVGFAWVKARGSNLQRERKKEREREKERKRERDSPWALLS